MAGSSREAEPVRRVSKQGIPDKAASYGLMVDASGRSTGVVAGRFTNLLARAGIGSVTEIKVDGLAAATPPAVRSAAMTATKMRKWPCGCTNVPPWSFAQRAMPVATDSNVQWRTGELKLARS